MTEHAKYGELTEFNSNAATLERIDRALRMCADASMNDDYNRWVGALAVCKREALVKMNHEKKRGMEDCKPECEKCYLERKYSSLHKLMFNIRRVSGKKDPMIWFQLSIDCDRYETYLREFMNAKGMLLRDTIGAMEKFKRG